MSGRYNTPQEGTLDWHIPLNENFSALNRDVEIRDNAANLDQYEPREGAKFLATDTGTVHIGDGSEWNRLGSLGSGGGSSTADDGSIIAASGDVQSAIDHASTGSEFGKGPSQVVKLVSGKTYEIDDTIKVRNGTILDCNGARIVPSGNFNVFELYRDTQLISPHVDTRGRNWNATQVVVGADDASKVEAMNRAWVRDAYLIGTPGEGIGLQFRGGSNGPCSMQWATGSISGFERAIDCYAAGGDISSHGDWSNGNQFYGIIRNFTIGVSMRSEGAAVSGNTFRLQAQPTHGVSEWLWYMEDDPRSSSQRGDNNYVMTSNTMHVFPWDNQNYTANPYYESDDRRPPVWHIGKGKQYANSMVDLSGRLGNEYIVNNSDFANRNGIFTAHGGSVTGTNHFSTPPVYQQNDSRVWHEDSTN